jgi:dihydrofolate synthase/folylpolyglutamate synthase
LLTPQEAKAVLESRGFGITPGLERIRALLELLDNPQLTYPTIHLAGTNGKSSTARMIAAILASSGLTAGLYTSPHLRDVAERYVRAGWSDGLEWEEIDDWDFAATLEYLLRFVQLVERDLNDSLTYFELSTAIAFEWMAQLTPGVGVIEAGMGGRWDATNVIDSSVAVLTSIDVDHSEFLGYSSQDNASEKVGIIRPGHTVVSADQKSEVAELIQSTADQKGADVLVEGRDFFLDSNSTAVGGRSVSVRTHRAEYPELFLALHGAHQGYNLALAVAASEAFLGRELDDSRLRAAVASVRSPGRLEVVRRQPLVVLDGAHNPHAAAALASTLPDDFLYDRLTIVLSIFKDKDVHGILDRLLPLAHRVILTSSDSPRAASPEDLRQMALQAGTEAELEVREPMEEAVNLALAASEEQDLVLITGSLNAVGQARSQILGPRERLS